MISSDLSVYWGETGYKDLSLQAALTKYLAFSNIPIRQSRTFFLNTKEGYYTGNAIAWNSDWICGYAVRGSANIDTIDAYCFTRFVSQGADAVLKKLGSGGEMIYIPYQAHPAGKAFSYTFPYAPKAIVILNGIGAGASPDSFALSDVSWILIYLRNLGSVSYYSNDAPQKQIGTLSVQGNVMTYPADGFPEREKYMIVTY